MILRVVSILAILLVSIFAKADQFKVVQMCDTQLGMGGYEHDVDSFEKAVGQINALKPDLVVICGDLVNTAGEKSFADFQRIRAGFEVPCHVASGNHDVENEPTAASLALYRALVGDDYFTVDHKGYTFVIVNMTFPLKSGPFASRVFLVHTGGKGERNEAQSIQRGTDNRDSCGAGIGDESQRGVPQAWHVRGDLLQMEEQVRRDGRLGSQAA